MLVIGGAGFIGSHLVDRLIAEGRAVDVVDDLSTGSLGNLADARAEASRLDVGELHIHTLDACSDDLATLIAMRRPREVFHLAARDPPRRRRPSRSGARSRRCSACSTRRGGPASPRSSSPCRRPRCTATRPARDLPVKEGALAPRGVRGVVAKAIVDLLSAYREDWGIEFTALAAGVGVRAAPAPRRRRRRRARRRGRRRGAAALTGDGRQSRDFVFVDDVVDALVRSGQRGQRAGRQRRHRRADVAARPVDADRARRRRAGRTSPARPDEVLRFAVSPVRARIHLGWSPWTTLAEGLDVAALTRLSRPAASVGAGEVGGDGRRRHDRRLTTHRMPGRARRPRRGRRRPGR